MLLLFRTLLVLVTGATLALAMVPTPPAVTGLETDPAKHAAGIFVIMALAGLAFPRSRVVYLLLTVAIGSGALEYIQGQPPFTRNPDAADWAAGMVGAIAAAALIAMWRTLRYATSGKRLPGDQ